MRVLPRVALGILTALLLPAVGTLAHDSQDGGARQSAAASPPSQGLIEAWSALLAARNEIAMDIEAGRADSLHENAEALPELAQAVMRQTSDLSDSKRVRVRSGVTQLSKVAEHLHGVAGTGEGKVLQGDLKRIDRALRLIRAQYPGDSLHLGTQSAAAGHAKGHHD